MEALWRLLCRLLLHELLKRSRLHEGVCVMTWMDDKELYRQFEIDDARAKAMQAALAEAEMGQMMQREPSPYLASTPGAEGNRAERRKQAAKARRAKP